jgi:hypothetical protein
MKWKTVVNTGAERGFVVSKARVTQTIGKVACWTMDGTDDGLSTSVPSATNGFLVVGLNHTTIAAGSKGLVQVYGMDDDATVCRLGTASDGSVAVGVVYDIYSASSCLKYYHAATDVINSASDGAQACFFVAAASVASGGASSLSTTTTKVFLRCL